MPDSFTGSTVRAGIANGEFATSPTLSTVGSNLIVDADNMCAATFNVNFSSFVGTFQFQASFDGTTWTPVTAVRVDGSYASTFVQTRSSTSGLQSFEVALPAGMDFARVQITARTSGSITVVGRASSQSPMAGQASQSVVTRVGSYLDLATNTITQTLAGSTTGHSNTIDCLGVGLSSAQLVSSKADTLRLFVAADQNFSAFWQFSDDATTWDQVNTAQGSATIDSKQVVQYSQPVVARYARLGLTNTQLLAMTFVRARGILLG